MEFSIIKGDVFKLNADALVFPANHKAVIGGSIDSKVFELAGKDKLLTARINCGELHSGEACITDSFSLKEHYRWLIHTAPPVYQPKHQMMTMHKLKKCYLSALKIAEEKQLRKLVFVLLGAGASGFSHDNAIKAVRSAISRYCSENQESSILSVTVVEYEKETQYQLLIKCNRHLKAVSRILPEIEGLEKYAQADSEIGRLILQISESVKIRTEDKITTLYEKYCSEINKYCEETGNSSDDYRNIIYDRIVRLNGMKVREFAEIMSEDDTLISRITNITQKKNGIDRKAVSFWKKRKNVLKLGISLELDISDMCLLMWSRGHSFPQEQFDFDLIELYFPDRNYDSALEAWHEEYDEFTETYCKELY